MQLRPKSNATTLQYPSRQFYVFLQLGCYTSKSERTEYTELDLRTSQETVIQEDKKNNVRARWHANDYSHGPLTVRNIPSCVWANFRQFGRGNHWAQAVTR